MHVRIRGSPFQKFVPKNLKIFKKLSSKKAKTQFSRNFWNKNSVKCVQKKACVINLNVCVVTHLCLGTGTFLTSTGLALLADEGPEVSISMTAPSSAFSLAGSEKEGINVNTGF